MKTSTLEKNLVSEQTVDLLSRLIALIPWPARRSAMGDVAVTILDGKPRVAENVFGWNRNAVELGMNELQTGIRCLDDISKRQKPKIEEKNPKLLSDIKNIIDPRSQAEPRLRTTLLYSDLTAKSVYDALLEEGWTKENLPTPRTISNILNRHNYRLRSVEKSQVQKKTEETDTIFENVWQVNAKTDSDPESLRISVDTKATINLGEYSRNGRSRGQEPVKALDHDMRPKDKLAPGGILETMSGKTFLFFTDSYKTSDFMADGLMLWWISRKYKLKHIKNLVINMDNGPECSGRRTPFHAKLLALFNTVLTLSSK